jgi:leucyl aminopeptidase
MTSLNATAKLDLNKPFVMICRTADEANKKLYTTEERQWITHQNTELKKELISLQRSNGTVYILILPEIKKASERIEYCRKAGDRLARRVNSQKEDTLQICGVKGLKKEILALAEGAMLGNYQFLKYFSKTDEKENSLLGISVFHEEITKADIDKMNIVADAVHRCRDLVNEPACALNAEQLSEALAEMGKEKNIFVEVMSKQKIEALRMGGLLAVNKGSVDPPTFTMMEYKPSVHRNKKPYVIIGKGVVYDSGGMSLKPSASMMDMKSDMAGAAAAACSVYAIASMELPLWVIALIPATDNRPGGNAQVPGDVITMYNGTTVEVLNTDAEGRLILADALAYAAKYRPALVIDLATLTGAAQAAVGQYASVCMQSRAEKELEQLAASGFDVCERLVEFPLWDDYKDLIKSDIADIKNIGGPYAGAITAAKFLEHFTSYPYIHIDIAGPAFLDKRDSYRGIGASGTGVRLLLDFFSKKAKLDK